MLLRKKELADALKKRMKELNIGSQLAFEDWLRRKGCEVDQTTISRLLNLEIKQDTKRVKELCRYAEIDIKKLVIKISPKESEILINALETAWDGTKPHERWLARVIKTAGAAPSGF